MRGQWGRQADKDGPHRFPAQSSKLYWSKPNHEINLKKMKTRKKEKKNENGPYISAFSRFFSPGYGLPAVRVSLTHHAHDHLTLTPLSTLSYCLSLSISWVTAVLKILKIILIII